MAGSSPCVESGGEIFEKPPERKLTEAADRAERLWTWRAEAPNPWPMASDPPTTDMDKLMASVGSVMLHWCFLEDMLTDTIRQLRIVSEGSASLIRVRGNFSDRLSEWRGLLSQKTRRNPEMAEIVADLANELEHLRGMRNRIAHNFAGADAAPEGGGEPYIWCAERESSNPNNVPERITLADLRTMIETMDLCRDRLGSIGLKG
jgi:hypothetical protein